MYSDYWDLKEEPFQNLTDLRFAYLSDQHSEGLARLLYLVRGRKLGGVLTGPYGVGKSMIMELLGKNVNDSGQSRFVRIDAPPGGTAAFVRHLLWALGYDQASPDPAEALQLLGAPCAPTPDTPSHTVIAVDEAQMIHEHSTFEFLHLLTNLRAPNRGAGPGHPAFTLLMCGHSDLLEALAREQSLCQRVQLVWKLEPLDARQTGEYIEHRMETAGAKRRIFDADSVDRIHAASRGLPRLINNICDVALMVGSAMQSASVSTEVVLEAIAEVESPNLVRPDDATGAE